MQNIPLSQDICTSKCNCSTLTQKFIYVFGIDLCEQSEVGIDKNLNILRSEKKHAVHSFSSIYMLMF